MQSVRHLPSDVIKQSSKTVSVHRRIAVAQLRIIPQSGSGPTIAQLIAEYDRHMEQVCGFSVSTRRLRRQHCRDLLKWRYGTRRVLLLRLRAKDLTKFVTNRVPDLSTYLQSQGT